MVRDLALHPLMDVFLCKTRFCQRLLSRHVAERDLKGRVFFTGHTSLDVRVEAGGGAQAAPATPTPAMNFSAFLHVKGERACVGVCTHTCLGEGRRRDRHCQRAASLACRPRRRGGALEVFWWHTCVQPQPLAAMCRPVRPVYHA